MPKKTYTDAARRYDELLALLCGKAYVRYHKLDFDRWSAECGLSDATLRRRIDAPEEITLGELRDIARPLGIPEDALRSAIPV